MAILDTKNGRRSVWLFHTVLKREMHKARPRVGEQVAIRFDGEVAPDGGGRKYMAYTVVVKREKGASVDWGIIDDEPDDPTPNGMRVVPRVEKPSAPDEAPF